MHPPMPMTAESGKGIPGRRPTKPGMFFSPPAMDVLTPPKVGRDYGDSLLKLNEKRA